MVLWGPIETYIWGLEKRSKIYEPYNRPRDPVFWSDINLHDKALVRLIIYPCTLWSLSERNDRYSTPFTSFYVVYS